MSAAVTLRQGIKITIIHLIFLHIQFIFMALYVFSSIPPNSAKEIAFG